MQARRRAGLSSFPVPPPAGSPCPGSGRRPRAEDGCSPPPDPSDASPDRSSIRRTPGASGNTLLRSPRSSGLPRQRSDLARSKRGLAAFSWRGIGSFGGRFFELSRACEVEGGMAPDGIVEPVDIAANGLVGFLAGVEDGPPDELGFQGLKERLHHGVVVAISLAGHRDQDAVLAELEREPPPACAALGRQRCSTVTRCAAPHEAENGRFRFHCGMARRLWGDDARILVRLMAGYRYTAAAQSGGRGSNITEILAALDRSTTSLGAAPVASRAASASRMTRAQRSANGIRS